MHKLRLGIGDHLFVRDQRIWQQEFINISVSARQGHTCAASGYCKTDQVSPLFAEA